MSELGFYLIITKPNKHKIETITKTDTAKNLDDAKNKIIYLIQEELQKINNLPDNLSDFIPIWFSKISADAEPFDYKIFCEGTWIKPWDLDELYENVYEILHKLELFEGYINTENQQDEEDSE